MEIPLLADQSTKALVGRLLDRHVRRHWKRLALAAMCMALTAGATALNAWMMEPVLDKVFVERNSAMGIPASTSTLSERSWPERVPFGVTGGLMRLASGTPVVLGDQPPPVRPVGAPGM